MTSTDELLNYGNKLIDNFKGVYALDQLVNVRPTGPIIVNTDTSNLPGTHWIAVAFRNDTAYCFDPLGYPPPLKVITWLNTNFNRWKCNLRQIQSNLSTQCGYYCLHFLYSVNEYNYIHLYNIINVIYPNKFSQTQYNSMIHVFINSKLK